MSIGTELRLGNWVTIHNPKSWARLKNVPLKVIGIEVCKTRSFDESMNRIRLEDKDRTTYAQMEQFIQPILITEEILLQCGFTNERAGLFGNVYRTGGFSIIYMGNGEYSFVSFPMIKFKHLHQLQNLYFATTDRELK